MSRPPHHPPSGSPSRQLEAKSQQAQAALEQRDQYLAHLQQYTASYQQLASEREEVSRHLLQQTQLMDRLQHDEVQGKVQLEISHKQLEQAQVSPAGGAGGKGAHCAQVYMWKALKLKQNIGAN